MKSSALQDGTAPVTPYLLNLGDAFASMRGKPRANSLPRCAFSATRSG